MKPLMDEKLFCRNCKGFRNHKEIFEEKKRGGDEAEYLLWVRTYSIIECLGCDTISFLETYGDTEMIYATETGEPDYYVDKTIYPFYLEKCNEIDNKRDIPEPIRTIYVETVNAIKSESYILAAGGLRAIIESICNHLKIKKGNLADRIDLLHNKGHLTQSESKRLHSIRFLGNDALHTIEKPKKEHIYILFDIVSHLLANLFINDKKLKNEVETIVDSYDELLKLIQNKINKSFIGNIYTLSEILGKSIRVIPNKKFKELEENIFKEVKSGNIPFLSIDSEDPDYKFKVEKEPEFTFDW